jgi:hypothetical protein
VSAAAAGSWMNAHKAALPNLSTDDSNFGAMLMSVRAQCCAVGCVVC